MSEHLRLVRFKAALLPYEHPDDPDNDCYVFIALVDSAGSLVEVDEIIGYNVYSVGSRQEREHGLVRLLADQTLLDYEHVLLSKPNSRDTEPGQLEHRNRILSEINVSIGAKFGIAIDDEYEAEIVSVEVLFEGLSCDKSFVRGNQE